MERTEAQQVEMERRRMREARAAVLLEHRKRMLEERKRRAERARGRLERDRDMLDRKRNEILEEERRVRVVQARARMLERTQQLINAQTDREAAARIEAQERVLMAQQRDILAGSDEVVPAVPADAQFSAALYAEQKALRMARHRHAETEALQLELKRAEVEQEALMKAAALARQSTQAEEKKLLSARVAMARLREENAALQQQTQALQQQAQYTQDVQRRERRRMLELGEQRRRERERARARREMHVQRQREIARLRVAIQDTKQMERKKNEAKLELVSRSIRVLEDEMRQISVHQVLIVVLVYGTNSAFNSCAHTTRSCCLHLKQLCFPCSNVIVMCVVYHA